MDFYKFYQIKVRVDYNCVNNSIADSTFKDIIILKEELYLALQMTPDDIKEDYRFKGILELSISAPKNDILITVKANEVLLNLDKGIKMSICNELCRLGYFINVDESEMSSSKLQVFKLSTFNLASRILLRANEFINNKELCKRSEVIYEKLLLLELESDLQKSQSIIEVWESSVCVKSILNSDIFPNIDYFLQIILRFLITSELYVLKILKAPYLYIEFGDSNDYKNKCKPVCQIKSSSGHFAYAFENVYGRPNDMMWVFNLKPSINSSDLVNFRGEKFLPSKIEYRQTLINSKIICKISVFSEGPQCLKILSAEKEWVIYTEESKHLVELFNGNSVIPISKFECFLISEQFKKQSFFDSLWFNFNQDVIKLMEKESVLSSLEAFFRSVKWDSISEGKSRVGKDNHFYYGIQYTLTTTDRSFDPYFAYLLAKQFHDFTKTTARLFPFEIIGSKMSLGESAWSPSYSMRVEKENVRNEAYEYEYNVLLQYNGYEHYHCLLNNIIGNSLT